MIFPLDWNFCDKNFMVLQIKNNARLNILITNGGISLSQRLEISFKRHHWRTKNVWEWNFQGWTNSSKFFTLENFRLYSKHSHNSWPKVLGNRVRNHYWQDFKLMAFSTAWEETHTSRISGSINGTQLCVHCENCQTVKSKSLSNKPCMQYIPVVGLYTETCK